MRFRCYFNITSKLGDAPILMRGYRLYSKSKKTQRTESSRLTLRGLPHQKAQPDACQQGYNEHNDPYRGAKAG